MGIYNSIKKRVANVNVFKKLQDTKKQLRIAMDGILKSSSHFFGYGSIHLYPRFPYGTNQLYEFSYNSDTLSIIHNSLRR